MRIVVVLSIAAAGLALAACDQQRVSQERDAAQRQAFRTVGIAACVRSAEARARSGAAGAPPSSDFQPVCTCYIDRVMAGKSNAELLDLRPGAREMHIIEQCASEVGSR
jgi:hypothetical protein